MKNSFFNVLAIIITLYTSLVRAESCDSLNYAIENSLFLSADAMGCGSSLPSFDNPGCLAKTQEALGDDTKYTFINISSNSKDHTFPESGFEKGLIGYVAITKNASGEVIEIVEGKKRNEIKTEFNKIIIDGATCKMKKITRFDSILTPSFCDQYQQLNKALDKKKNYSGISNESLFLVDNYFQSAIAGLAQTTNSQLPKPISLGSWNGLTSLCYRFNF